MFLNILFIMSALLTVASTVGVVFSKNIMHACMFLLGTLFGVAGLYATLGADFLAATQLVVYAGGVVILMLFAIMLTGGHKDAFNRFGLERLPAMGNNKTYIIAGLSTIVIGLTIAKIVLNSSKFFKFHTHQKFDSSVERIGELLVTDHVLSFEISSILLLGALVGAAVISRPRRRGND